MGNELTVGSRLSSKEIETTEQPAFWPTKQEASALGNGSRGTMSSKQPSGTFEKIQTWYKQTWAHYDRPGIRDDYDLYQRQDLPLDFFMNLLISPCTITREAIDQTFRGDELKARRAAASWAQVGLLKERAELKMEQAVEQLNTSGRWTFQKTVALTEMLRESAWLLKRAGNIMQELPNYKVPEKGIEAAINNFDKARIPFTFSNRPRQFIRLNLEQMKNSKMLPAELSEPQLEFVQEARQTVAQLAKKKHRELSPEVRQNIQKTLNNLTTQLREARLKAEENGEKPRLKRP